MPTAHERLFERYCTELHESRALALAWWRDLRERELRVAGTHALADQRLLDRWPFGPASHPYVLATFRRFWALNERLNAALEARPHPVSPEDEDWFVQILADLYADDSTTEGYVLLVDMLYGRDDVLAEFMEAMVFKPIAVDGATGRFV
jgi:hypothetical protein